MMMAVLNAPLSVNVAGARRSSSKSNVSRLVGFRRMGGVGPFRKNRSIHANTDDRCKGHERAMGFRS
jgi:hypothetical protein